MSAEATPPPTMEELRAMAKRLPDEIDAIMAKYRHLLKATK
jgi:hypothetical protein